MSAEAVGEYTLNVSTPEPDPILLQRMDFVSISSAKQLAEDPDSFHTKLIGTGPYKFVRWRKGQSLTYEANPDWWGISDPVAARGVISFQTITFKVLAEDQIRAAGVKAGETDIAQYVTAEECKAAASNRGTRCDSAASVETLLVRMDTMSPMLGDIRVRKALVAAIDTSLIVETILGGAATVTGQIINATALGNNPNLAPYQYDPAYARFLLAEARADGVPVDMKIELGARRALFAGVDEMIEAMADMWRVVGLNVSTTSIDPDGFGKVCCIEDVPEDRNLVLVHMHGNEILDFAYTYGLYYSCEGPVSVYCNPAAEKVYDEARQLSGEARDKKLQELNKILYDDVPMGYIAHMDLSYAVSDKLDWKVKLDHRLLGKKMAPVR
jgi:peptide/nickel transport system substrate-binding protein